MKKHNACLLEYNSHDSQYARCLMIRVYPKPTITRKIIPYRAAQIVGKGLVNDGFKVDRHVDESIDTVSTWFWDSDIGIALDYNNGRLNTKKLDIIGLKELKTRRHEDMSIYLEDRRWCEQKLTEGRLRGCSL